MKKPASVGKRGPATSVWATGIFKGDSGEVYTLSVIIPRICSGASIQKKLMRGQKGSALVKVLLTKGEYSPMNWWAYHPAVLNKKKDALWGDGEGVSKEWWS